MPTLTRRDALIAGAALAVPAGAEPVAPRPTLREAARSSRRFFGAAVQSEQIRNDAGLRDAVLLECDSLTPELALKWAAIEPARGAVNLGPMDELAGIARQHGKRLYGHTLLWHRSIPDWARDAIRDTKNWDILHAHFQTVMPRYGDVIDYWDVVNEPIEPLDHADGLRNGLLLQTFGPEYIRRALDSARAIAPHAGLVINEYGLEYPDAESERRRRRLLRLIDDLRRIGAPLDGIGLQAHLGLEQGRVDQSVLRAFLEQLRDRGLFVVVTEFDVREVNFRSSIARRDQRVAAVAQSFLDVVLDDASVRGLTTWGLSDRYSWLNGPEGVRGSPPGGGNRGLPFDASMQAKPLCFVIAEALQRGKPG